MLLVASAGLPATIAAQTAADLDWLAGCWEIRTFERVVSEQWMHAGGGVMLGMNRTVIADAASGYEFMYIGPVEGRLSFVARPSGQAGATFPVVAMSDTSVVFEQPTHDFPQRIEYRRRGPDFLFAQIEGPLNGEHVSVPFLFRRVTCPG